MKKHILTAALAAVALTLAGCAGREEGPAQEDTTEMKMNVQIGEYTFTATLEQNQAVEELLEMLP